MRILDPMFKGVDKKELLGYIDGARQFVKYMKSHPMESVNEAKPSPEQAGKLFDKLLKKQTKGNLPSTKDIEIVFSLLRKKYGIKGESVTETQKRDYKAEYKKFQSSTKAKKLVWSSNIRIGLVDKEMLRYMKESGCWMVLVGIESGNQEILNMVKKQIKLQQAEQLSNWCTRRRR